MMFHIFKKLKSYRNPDQYRIFLGIVNKNIHFADNKMYRIILDKKTYGDQLADPYSRVSLLQC
jgi:hypothetical protein